MVVTNPSCPASFIALYAVPQILSLLWQLSDRNFWQTFNDSMYAMICSCLVIDILFIMYSVLFIITFNHKNRFRKCKLISFRNASSV